MSFVIKGLNIRAGMPGLILGLVLLHFAGPAHGENLLSSRLGVDGDFFRSSTKPQFSLSARTSTYFRYNKEYFGSELNDNSLSTLGVKFKKQARRDFVLDGEIFYSYTEEKPYYDIADFHYYRPVTGGWEVRVGRARYLWSRSDEFWQMGMWQPRFMWDELDTHSQGLIGIMAGGPFDRGWRLSVMASPIFHPELTQEFKVEDGEIKSSNPWFRPPPPLVELLGKDTDLQADVKKPDVGQVAFNPGFVAQLAWERDTRFMSFSYAYKPINQFYQSIDVINELRATNSFLDAVIEPRILYHHLASLEAGRSWSRWHTWGNLTFELPVEEKLPEERKIHQMTEDTMLASAFLAYDFRRMKEKSRQWYLGVMNLQGGDTHDSGSLASEDTKFERRFRFNTAVKTGYKNDLPFRWNSQSLATALEITYDTAQRGAIFSGELLVNPHAPLSAYFRVDVIGLLDTKPAQVEDGFIPTYRANDRLAMGMNYVF